MYQKDNAVNLLKNKILSSKNEKAKLAYSFLLSLVFGADDIKKPAIELYKMFGYEGAWHSAKFEESLISIDTFGVNEIESKNKISILIGEIITIINSLSDIELIPSYIHDSLIAKLQSIKDQIQEKSLNRVEVQNILLNSAFIPEITSYSQATVASVHEKIQTEIRDFLNNETFENYYQNKKSKSVINEDWNKSPPEFFLTVNNENEKHSNRFLFFTPFRQFIRDAIYNSIWVTHGIRNEYSVVIEITPHEEYLEITFKSLANEDNFFIQPRDYNTRIDSLAGSYSFDFESNDLDNKNFVFILSLKIPSIEKFRE